MRPTTKTSTRKSLCSTNKSKFLLSPSLRKYSQEDAKLLELVGQYGPKQWSVISSVRLEGENKRRGEEERDATSRSRPAGKSL